MAKKMEWTVRVVNLTLVNGEVELPRLWLEQLRYLGMARELASYDDRNVLEFTCPNKRELDTKVWAEQNAARMRSFGIDAAAAPKWDDERFSADTAQLNSAKGEEIRVAFMERLNRPKSAV